MGLKGLKLLQARIIAFHFKLRLEQACGYCTPEQPNPNDTDSFHLRVLCRVSEFDQEIGLIRIVIPPKVDLGARLPAAADGSLPQWPPCQPRSLLIPPLAAYSKGPGLTEFLRLYVCGL